MQFYFSDQVVNATADSDSDGWNNLEEFAFGADPTASGDLPYFKPGVVQVDGESYFAVSFQRRLTAGDLTYQVCLSQDQESWDCSPDLMTEHSAEALDSVFEIVTMRQVAPMPGDGGSHAYARISVTRP